MRPWWQRFPARWEREQAALSEAGWDWSADESQTGHGILGLKVAYRVPEEYQAVITPGLEGETGAGDGRVWLRVLFPAAYPFFPPSVRDHEHRLRLPRHREPIAGKLCLIEPGDWGTGMTAADLLATQLPRMLAAATSSGPPPSGWEVPAAEPLGRYTPDHVGARILIDHDWTLPPEVTQGSLVVGFTQFRSGELGAGLVKILEAGGELLETFPDRLGDQFRVTAPGRWLRWDGFTPGMTALEAWGAVDPLLHPLKVRIEGLRPSCADLAVEVIGVLVPSEVAYRQPGEEWFFAVRHRREPDAEWRYELYHSTAAGAHDVRARTPTAAGLADRGVLLVGVGAIGGAVAAELARAGIGGLHLVDGDVVDPATGCRQYAPAIFAGFAKTAVLRHLLAETNPHVAVHANGFTLGAVHAAGDEEGDPHEHMVHLIEDVDLVIDAAADPAVSRYLAALAAVRDTAFLHVSATAGGHGGLVAVISPNRPGCWWCMLYHRRDHTLPFPPAAPDGTATVVPVGCAEPTFTGTSADLATVAVHAARVAIDRLTAPPDDPQMRGDLYVAALRDHHGRPIPVRWRTRPIPIHPNCPMRSLHAQQPVTTPSAITTPSAPTRAACAATAQSSTRRTVTTAAGAPTRKAATARTLTTPQRTQDGPTVDSARRGGARPESGPTGGDMPWPPETAPTPATEPPNNQ